MRFLHFDRFDRFFGNSRVLLKISRLESHFLSGVCCLVPTVRKVVVYSLFSLVAKFMPRCGIFHEFALLSHSSTYSPYQKLNLRRKLEPANVSLLNYGSQ